MRDEDFIAEIHANPHDETPRLVYADWLEDHDDPRAEYLRIDCELMGLTAGDVLYDELHPRQMTLRSQMPAAWLADIGRSRVMNCSEVTCPRLWKRLQTTSVGTIRICDVCQQPVQYFASIGAAAANSIKDQRVVVDRQFSENHFHDVIRRLR